MCPLCCNEYWNCFDENFDEMFPRLVTETGAEQACPVCMGEDFAEMDVEYVEQLEEYKAQLGQGTNPDDLSEEEFEECKNNFLALVRERYKILNVRRAEMGLPWMWDIEDRVRRHRRVFIEDKDPVDTSSESESDEEEETDFDDGDDDDLDDDDLDDDDDGDGDDGDD